MSRKLDEEVSILKMFQKFFKHCDEDCEYHKKFKAIENKTKEEVFKTLQTVLELLLYHESDEHQLPVGVKGDILMIINLMSTEYSTIEVVNWFIDTLIKIDNQKKLN